MNTESKYWFPYCFHYTLHSDYCLLTALPQSVLNTEARVILLKYKSSDIIPLLKSFHWFPITLVIKAKVLLVAYKVLYHQSFISSLTFSPIVSSLDLSPARTASFRFLEQTWQPPKSRAWEGTLAVPSAQTLFPPHIHISFPPSPLAVCWNVTFIVRSFLTRLFNNVHPNSALPIFLPFFEFLHIASSHLTDLYLLVYHLSSTNI